MSKVYDHIVIGGGLAGLSYAILMKKKGYSVLLFEKKHYPFHRVCGEYISMESWNFLLRLGLNLDQFNLPRINRFQISTPSGFLSKHPLDLGGFGISRYTLDHELSQLAKSLGVEVLEGTTVKNVKKIVENNFEIFSSKGTYFGKFVVGSFGKRSVLDKSLDRTFLKGKAIKKGVNNFIGVKYHVQADLADDLIELHNFEDGYCGISKIEGGKYCMCYLTKASNLEKVGGSIERMEKEILSKNPILNKYLSSFPKLYPKPISISQIDFSKKEVIEDDVFMIGDAAGLIAPLSGNGMSIALRGASLLSELVDDYFKEQYTFEELKYRYAIVWNAHFNKRLKLGRLLQKTFGKSFITEIVIRTLSLSDFLMQKIIRATHGQKF